MSCRSLWSRVLPKLERRADEWCSAGIGEKLKSWSAPNSGEWSGVRISGTVDSANCSGGAGRSGESHTTNEVQQLVNSIGGGGRPGESHSINEVQ